MYTEPIHVADADFENNVLKNELPVLVDFWAPWCGPCKMIAPFLDKMAKDYSGKLVIAKIDTDESPQWAIHYGVQGIPTLLLFKDGALVWQHVGAMPEKMLREEVGNYISLS